jgi:hypothetical protein
MHDVFIRCIGTHIYRLHGGAATSSNIHDRRGPSVIYKIHTCHTYISSLLIIRLEVVMVQKPWYVKKPSESFVRQKNLRQENRQENRQDPASHLYFLVSEVVQTCSIGSLVHRLVPSSVARQRLEFCSYTRPSPSNRWVRNRVQLDLG